MIQNNFTSKMYHDIHTTKNKYSPSLKILK